jgi:precorrin-8X/cobalt-precorrin-8 methylmutase
MNQRERIILIGHGSPKKEANAIHLIAELLHGRIHGECNGQCVKVAYLQFGQPDIMTAIKSCAEDGVSKIILHPFFLSSGIHVTKDIPEIIAQAERLYPTVEFVYTDPLGTHEKLVEIVMDRIKSAEFGAPQQIEERSFEIIAQEIDLSHVPPEQAAVVKRVIHATADFEFKRTLTFSAHAIKAGLDAIKAGKDILADVEMVRTGINKKLLGRWGGKVICAIADHDVAALSEKTGKTRAEIALEKGLAGDVGIVAIGNAPTALLKAIEILGKRPAGSPAPLVVGVPVGFVKALESKALLASQNFPFITNLSRKGGTPVAVAIVNALLKMAEGG